MAVAQHGGPARGRRAARHPGPVPAGASRRRAWRRSAAGGSAGASATPTSRTCSRGCSGTKAFVSLALFDDADSAGDVHAAPEPGVDATSPTSTACATRAPTASRWAPASTSSATRRSSRSGCRALQVSTPTELLAMARQLLDRASPGDRRPLAPRGRAARPPGPRDGGRRLSGRRAPDPARVLPDAPQLICLREYLDDDDLAGRVHHAWNALSRACHHHPYELAPTAGELAAWLETVERWVSVSGAKAAR